MRKVKCNLSRRDQPCISISKSEALTLKTRLKASTLGLKLDALKIRVLVVAVFPSWSPVRPPALPQWMSTL